MKKSTPEYVKRHLKDKLFARRRAPIVGSASRAWYRWDVAARVRVLCEWTKMFEKQAYLFCTKEWFALSKWVRASLKKFFRTEIPESHTLYSLRNVEG
jgi:hypothetical protein